MDSASLTVTLYRFWVTWDFSLSYYHSDNNDDGNDDDDDYAWASCTQGCGGAIITNFPSNRIPVLVLVKVYTKEIALKKIPPSKWQIDTISLRNYKQNCKVYKFKQYLTQ